MKTSHSLTFHITNDTFVTSYHNGYNQSCTFVEDGESLNICFDRNCLSKLSEAITKLQEVYQMLVEERRREIVREFDSLILPTPKLPTDSTNSRSSEETEMAF